MPRIRSVKPHIWSDDRVGGVSRDARLLFVGMITQADDEGRLVASGSSLLGSIYPYDDVTPKQVERWRDELADVGLVRVYTVGRASYAELASWGKHQRIQKRQPSSLPGPPDVDEYATSTRPVAEPLSPQSRTSRAPSRRRGGETVFDQSDTEREREREREVEKYSCTSPGRDESRTAPIVGRSA